LKQDARLCSPAVPSGTVGARDFKVYPTECRQRYTTYKGDFFISMGWWLNGVQQPTVEKCVGAIPIMLKVGLKL